MNKNYPFERKINSSGELALAGEVVSSKFSLHPGFLTLRVTIIMHWKVQLFDLNVNGLFEEGSSLLGMKYLHQAGWCLSSRRDCQSGLALVGRGVQKEVVIRRQNKSHNINFFILYKYEISILSQCEVGSVWTNTIATNAFEIN